MTVANTKAQRAFNKYEKRFNKFMSKLNKDVKNDPDLKKENKEWNVFAGICHAIRSDINKFLKRSRNREAK